MNFQEVYKKSSGTTRTINVDDEQAKREKEQEEHEKKLIEAQHSEWLQFPNTKALILFLASRELQCLDAARNNVGKNRELTDQFLYRSKEIRKIINYAQTGREESDTTSS